MATPQLSDRTAARLYADLYDASVADWPGEIEAYLALAAEATARGQPVLELACGTGRIARRLAAAGAAVVGLDFAPEMLARARAADAGPGRPRWVEADMRSFRLNERFGLAIIAGHSFQNLVTPDDQLACLAAVRDHLVPLGRLVVHLDLPEIEWLGSLRTGLGGVFEAAETVIDPVSGHPVRASYAWTYEPSTQNTTLRTLWETLAEDGAVLDLLETEPIPIHVVFPVEMAHLLGRARFEVEAVHGDFRGTPLGEGSSQMIWRARRPIGP